MRAFSVVGPLAGLVGAALLLIGATMVHGSLGLDTVQREGEERIVAQAVTTLRQGLSSNARDCGFWNDTVRHLVHKLDLTWADKNVGPYITDTFGWDSTFVVGPDDSFIYAQVDGERMPGEALPSLSPSLGRLIEHVRILNALEARALSGIVEIDGETYMAAAASVLPENDAVKLPEGPRTILVFAERLDAVFLEGLAQDFGLAGLTLVDDPPSTALARVALTDADGVAVRWVAWEPQRPGWQQLAWLVPELLVSLLVFGAFVALAVRNIRRATQEIRRSEARFRDIAEAASDWIWETDGDLRLTYVSEAGLAAMRLSLPELLHRRLDEVLFPPGGPEQAHALLDVLPAQGQCRDVICRLRTPGLEPRTLRVAGKTVLDGTGRRIGYRGTATDITAETAALEQARYLAEHDTLTGLPNRLLLRDRLRDALLRCDRYGTQAAVLCLDLDRFKEVNDSLGHAAGDALLVEAAERIGAHVRETDTLARLGGDEFAILQTDIAQIGDIERMCQRIVEVPAQPFRLDGHEVMVTASIGVALAPSDGHDPARLLQNADIALYRAKADGRDRFCFFEAGMDEQLRQRKLLEADLRKALVLGQLELHYQPQVGTTGERIVGVEALLRWRHPDRGLVLPQDFISLAEETGLIVPIGDWVLRTACAAAARWPDLRMSVNVSAVQFKQRDLVEKVAEALEAAQLPPNRLELEITESLLLQGTSEALAVLSRLKGLGVKIAMDDFGTGYSSLSYLQKFPFDKIKIDRSFVAGMDQREDAGAIVRAIVQLGHSLGMQTCAEGVETIPQLELLRHEGCTEAQGYMFGRPTPAPEIDRLLLAQTSTVRRPDVERPQRAAKPRGMMPTSLAEPVA